jgi:hypothetical protein
MGPGQPTPTRKRNRKRKRRVVFDSSSSEQDSSSSSSDASTPNKAVTIPVRRPNPSKNADADKAQVSSSSDETPEDDTDPDEVHIAMPSSRPGRSVEPPLQRESPPSPQTAIPPFVHPIPNAPPRERARPQGHVSHVLDGISHGEFQGRSRGDPQGVCPPEGHLQRFPGLTSRSHFVRWWIGTESWFIAAGPPHRVACFRCRRVLFELCRWLCE